MQESGYNKHIWCLSITNLSQKNLFLARVMNYALKYKVKMYLYLLFFQKAKNSQFLKIKARDDGPFTPKKTMNAMKDSGKKKYELKALNENVSFIC